MPARKTAPSSSRGSPDGSNIADEDANSVMKMLLGDEDIRGNQPMNGSIGQY